MLVAGFPAGSFGTNCYVLAVGPGQECVIVDPGMAATDGIAEIVREHRLKPVAVVLTHGHIDHTFCVVPVCSGYGIPAFIHPADRPQLADPASGLGLAAGSELFGGMTFSEPAEVRELADGLALDLAGVRLQVSLAPGHTEGSVTFLTLPAPGEATDPGATEPLLFAGDVLFAGSIGRMDLPGGDEAQMVDSLRRVILPLSDDTVVLPGHGETTTIGRERASNPYLGMVAAGARSFTEAFSEPLGSCRRGGL